MRHMKVYCTYSVYRRKKQDVMCNIFVNMNFIFMGLNFYNWYIQPVSYKRYFRCNNCLLLLVYTIHLYKFGRPATDGYHLYETPVS